MASSFRYARGTAVGEERGGEVHVIENCSDENKPTGSIKIRVETIGYFLKRYREDIVRNKHKATDIERQLREFEARLRRQMLREKLEDASGDSLVRESFETGAMPQIHVSVGALAASRPQMESVQGD